MTTKKRIDPLEKKSESAEIESLNPLKNQEEKLDIISSNTILSLSIPGRPTTKLRPRFARIKKFVRTYDSQEKQKETYCWQIKSRTGNMNPVDGPLVVTLIFIFKKPKSYSKGRNKTFHTVKPDLDNLVKWILDVGNKILWYDDKQVVKIAAIKIYGEEERTIITLEKAVDSYYRD